MIGLCAEQVLEIAALWWQGFSHRSLPGRKQKKGNKEGLREKEKGGRRELTQSLARSQSRPPRVNVRTGDLFKQCEERTASQCQINSTFYSENKRDFELLRDSGIRGLSFQPQSVLLLISTLLEFFLKYFNVDKRRKRD